MKKRLTVEGEERIYLPTQEEVLAFQRWEDFHIRAKKLTSLFEKRDSAVYHFNSYWHDEPRFNYTAGWAKELFAIMERSLHLNLVQAGLDDLEWRTDWKALMDNEIPPFTSKDNECSHGHQMTTRFGNHWLCMIDGEIKWFKPT